ncbi:GlyGly-CTERM sorting domain-containing protein [Colwellia piezophila]|uniref:GlyGly-CTERM sorting domain-containing protein n=1 Tax=Colwellia piezophila TaxID=211668 RepID=UPI0003651ECC|nr:GlyGly-CTERM sorting domain-containing protein [Colwellia piezophila]
MKLTKVALCLIAATQIPSVWAAQDETQDNYLCGNRVAGQVDSFGQTHYGCDVAAFGDTGFVEQKLSELVFDDAQTSPQDYVSALYPVLRDAASYYIEQRNAVATSEEIAAWQNAVLALAQQASFWTHYRRGIDGLIKMSRGDNGHGHGLMQIDDRAHFADIKAGKGWHLFENITFALDVYYPHWLAANDNTCVTDLEDETGLAKAQFAYAAYNAGDALQGCRFSDESTNQWAELDAQFAVKYTEKVWLDLVDDVNSDAPVNTSCFMMGDEGCVVVGTLPAAKADLGSTGRIFGETYYGSPNTIAACRTLPDDESVNVEWIRTTTNAWATFSILNLVARQGDYVQVAFEYNSLTNMCWTKEDSITWDGFEPPAPANDTLFAYKQLQLSTGETCLHSEGQFHCVTQAKDALCLTETLNQVVDPITLVLGTSLSESQEKIIYDRHQCLPVVSNLFSVGDSIELVQDMDAFASVGGSVVGNLISGSKYQVLDMVADTKYAEHRYYKVLISEAYTIAAYTEGEGETAIEHEAEFVPGVTGYVYAGMASDSSDYVAAASNIANEALVILRAGDNLKIDVADGVKMLSEVGGTEVLTIPQGTVLEVTEVTVMGDNNKVYYSIHRKGIDGLLYAGSLAPELNLNADFSVTADAVTLDNTTAVPTQDTEQQVASGGSFGVISIMLAGLFGFRRKNKQ